MQSPKRTISPLLYFILISSLTNLTFLLAGIAVLAFFSVKLSGFGLQIIIFLLLWKGGLVGLVAWFSHKKANNKDFLVKFVGIYLGRFFGIFVGGLLGARISNIFMQADIIGFIVGALVFYFSGRWIGSKVSAVIGRQLDKVFFMPELPEPEKTAVAKSTRKFTFVAFTSYGLILPLLLVVIGVLINFSHILPTGYLTELLPISRIAVIILSIFSVCSPWLIKNRWLIKFQPTTSSPEIIIYWLGLVFSIAPAVYGFILFIAMGASIIELCFYAVASFIAAIIWSMNNKESLKQNTG